MPADSGFCTKFPVRFADIDHAGIVYYPRYFHFFHIAFEELFTACFDAKAYVTLLNDRRLGFPAVHAECDFVGPLRFGDIAEVWMQLDRIGDSSLSFSYRIYSAATEAAPRRLCARGKNVVVAVSLDTFAKAPLPQDIVAALAKRSQPSHGDNQ